MYNTDEPSPCASDGGAQEFGMRAGTENIASIVGMAKALEICCDALKTNAERLLELERVMLDRLTKSGLDFVRNGSKNHIPGNISLSFKGADGEVLLHRLDLHGIYVSTGSACDSVNTQISHVLQAINLADEYAKGTIRISLDKDNTVEEANTIADSIIGILNEKKQITKKEYTKCYRYGRWRCVHNRQHGCEFDGNKGL